MIIEFRYRIRPAGFHKDWSSWMEVGETGDAEPFIEHMLSTPETLVTIRRGLPTSGQMLYCQWREKQTSA